MTILRYHGHFHTTSITPRLTGLSRRDFWRVVVHNRPGQLMKKTPPAQNGATERAVGSPVTTNAPNTKSEVVPSGLFQAAWILVSRWRFGPGLLLAGVLASVVVSILPADLKQDIWNSFLGRLRWSELGGSLPGFEVIAQDREVDLTQWQSQDDVAYFRDKFELRKTRNGVAYFSITAGSTGSQPEVSGDHGPKTLKMQDMNQVGWPSMRTQILVASDVSSEPADRPFPLSVTTKRIGGFRDAKNNWCSVGVWHPTRVLQYTVRFPAAKMGHDFKLKRGFFDDQKNLEEVPFEKEHTRSDKNEFVWTIEHPLIGYAYQIHWQW